jgi:hypothetical protein
MRLFITIILLSLLNAKAVESPLKVHKNAAIIYFGAYDPPAPTNWMSIPEPARSNIIMHLKIRLGDNFYSKLSLVGGQIVDIEMLHKKYPESKNYEWEIPAYLLHLRFSFPELGIEYYDACIECRSDGSVIHEIDLPEIAKHPMRGHFISTSKAVEAARQNGFDEAKATAEIDYRADVGICVFMFRQMTRHDGAGLFFKCIDIDAHTGKVSKIYESKAME